jgi:hypothetical protein
MTKCDQIEKTILAQTWREICLWDWEREGAAALSDCIGCGGYVMKALATGRGEKKRYRYSEGKAIRAEVTQFGEYDTIGIALVQPLKQTPRRSYVWKPNEITVSAWKNPVWWGTGKGIWEITYLCGLEGTGIALTEQLVFHLVHNFACQAIVLAATNPARGFWNRAGWTLGLITATHNGTCLTSTSTYRYWQDRSLCPMTLIIDKTYRDTCLQIKKEADEGLIAINEEMSRHRSLYEQKKDLIEAIIYAFEQDMLMDAHDLLDSVSHTNWVDITDPASPIPTLKTTLAQVTSDYVTSRRRMRDISRSFAVANRFQRFVPKAQIDTNLLSKVRSHKTINPDDVVRCNNINAQTLDARNRPNETVLHIAAREGHDQAVRVLTRHRADTKLLNGQKKSAKEVTGNLEILRLLNDAEEWEDIDRKCTVM